MTFSGSCLLVPVGETIMGARPFKRSSVIRFSSAVAFKYCLRLNLTF